MEDNNKKRKFDYFTTKEMLELDLKKRDDFTLEEKYIIEGYHGWILFMNKYKTEVNDNEKCLQLIKEIRTIIPDQSNFYIHVNNSYYDNSKEIYESCLKRMNEDYKPKYDKLMAEEDKLKHI